LGRREHRGRVTHDLGVSEGPEVHLAHGEDAEDRESVSERFSLCSVEPFVFTHRTKVNEIAEPFSKWLDASLAVAVKEYGDRP
jgi:hypothetical protein